MAVEVGEQAPDFELKDQHGTPVRLSGFRGAKNVVLVFYPLAFSGVCSGELCAMRDEFPEATRGRCRAAGRVGRLRCSRCGPGPTPKVSGSRCCRTSGRTARSPGPTVSSMTNRGIATRGTFIIDKDGVVRWKVVNPMPQARDIADYQKALAALD